MIRSSSVLFWFGLAIIASLGFYRTTDNVQALGQKLRSLNASIESEQQTIHVLKAEWVYLSNPARVEAEARKHLTLRPTAPQQVARMNELTEILPTRDEAMSSVAVNSAPIATVKTSLVARVVHAVAANTSKPKPKNIIAVAAADSGHINERMVMQHNSAPASPDTIGNLITELGSHP